MTTTNGHLKLKDSEKHREKSLELYLSKYSITIVCFSAVAISLIQKIKI